MQEKDAKKGKMGLIVISSTAFLVVVIGVLAFMMRKTPIEIGLFSWQKSAIIEEEIFFSDAESLGITEVYQEIAPSVQIEEVRDFLAEAQERNVAVYMLVGEPEWGLQEDAKELIDAIDRVRLMNSSLEDDMKIKGIVVDVEPYSLKEWKKDSARVMRVFAEAMKTAYAYANQNNIEMILCVPYHYDKQGFEKELEELTAYACDGIAVMNYYRDKEIPNMETEAEYAAKYDKSIVTIYEMKAAGTHGLTEKNTYHELGFEPVIENFRKVSKAFRGQKVKMAYHDYEAVKEVMQNK